MTRQAARPSPPRRWALLMLSVMFGSILATATTAHAQCAPVGDLKRALAAADSVFVGEVVEVSSDARIARVRISSIWKGRDLPATVEVRGTTEPDSAMGTTDRRFELQATYLVVPENTRPPFLATSCSATQIFTAIGNVIPEPYQDAVGSTTGRAPSGVGTIDDGAQEAALVGSVLPMLGLSILIVIVLILVSRLRANEPEDAIAADPPPKARRFRHRNLARDVNAGTTVADRLVKKNRRRWKIVRWRQDRKLAASSRRASGSTDTS